MLSFFVLCSCNCFKLYWNTISFLSRIPGAKIGLANVVTLTLLLCFGFKEALIVLLLRIMIVAMAFTNLYMFLYSLAGGILSLFIMFIFNKTKLIFTSY